MEGDIRLSTRKGGTSGARQVPRKGRVTSELLIPCNAIMAAVLLFVSCQQNSVATDAKDHTQPDVELV